VPKRGEGADEGERGLDGEQEREDNGGSGEPAAAREDGGDVLPDEDQVGHRAARLRQDDDDLREVPADRAEAFLAQVAVGVVAITGMLMASLLLLCVSSSRSLSLHSSLNETLNR
jgi:hypothetical protein